MNDKIVTHADLDAITVLDRVRPREYVSEDEYQVVAELLARLRAAAEADQPPLPEGWYSWRTDSNGNVHVWHDGNDRLWLYDSCKELFGYVTQHRDRLSPLRPTITREDVKRAHVAWLRRPGSTLEALLVAFRAGGIEVAP